MNKHFVKYKRIPEVLKLNQLSSITQEDVQVFEKIDGGNCQIRKIDGRLYSGSKANFLIGDPVYRAVWFPRMLSWMYSNHSLYNLPENLILFGEWSGNHTITYSPPDTDKFFMIDLFDLENQRFIPYDEAVSRVKKMGVSDIRFLNILAEGKVDIKKLEHILDAQSSYYPGKKEGLVIKSYLSNPQEFYKILNSRFKEQRQNLFGKIDPFTDARFRKNFFKVIDEGENLPLDSLIALIRRDIKQETGHDYEPGYIKKRLGLYLSRGHKS